MKYLSPGEIRRIQSSSQQSKDAQKRIDETGKLSSTALEVVQLLSKLEASDYVGAIPIQVVRPLGRIATLMADKDNVGVFPRLSPRRKVLRVPNIVERNRVATPRAVNLKNGPLIIQGHSVVEDTLGWVVSRKRKAPREGTYNFLDPISDRNSIIVDRTGTVYGRFETVSGIAQDEEGRLIEGKAVLEDSARPFNGGWAEDGPVGVPLKQQELIVDHLKFYSGDR